MHDSIRRAIAALTVGDDAQRHFDLAAERIQHALLDVTIPALPGIDIGVHAEPSRLVGGDYIDLLISGPNGLAFGLGDASGKSLAAALNALMLRYLVRGLVSALDTHDLPAIVRHANRVVSGDIEAGSFITFVLGVVDAASGEVRIVNAGHEPPLLIRGAGGPVDTVDAHGLVLGIDAASEFPEQTVRLESGDTLIVYTDGLTEATNDRGELYTIEQLQRTLGKLRDLAAQELAGAVFASVKAFAGGELRDDSTVLVIRRT